MRKLISQIAQLVGTAAETVARHARDLSDKPEAPTPAPSSPTASESLVHLIACDMCHAQYDVTGYMSSSLRCRCGHLVQVRAPTAVQRPVERCGACGGPLANGAEACGFCGGRVERDKRALSLLCPECFAANPRRSQFCCSCGVTLEPEAVGAAKATRHACPVCAVPLFERRLGNAWVEECTQCHGLFITVSHFQHLVQHASQAPKADAVRASPAAPRAPASATVVYRRCPECNELMQRRNYERASGVVVDICVLHGHWLDANELEAIGRFISSGEQARLREREALEAEREKERARNQRTVEGFGAALGGRRSFFDVLGD